MKRALQPDFFTTKSRGNLKDYAKRTKHGGEVRQGRRKLARPFDRKRPLHLVLKADRARGEWSMLRFKKADAIQLLIQRLARANHIRIYQYANSGNHLHFLLKAKNKEGFQKFLRTLTAITARLVTGAKKGNPVGKFWSALAWSEVINWGKHFFNGRYYIIRNELEAEGLIKPRVNRRP